MVLLAELAMLAVFAVAGARLGSGAAALALAVLLPMLVAILWGLCLAPRARRRLPHPWRLVVKLVLMVAGAGLLAASGAALWGVVFLIVASLLVTGAELRTRASQRS
ncbi:MAG: YrdB family protein [Salinisphaera sp.]|nr:YrdB family protein [Salinisphaera sp.]